MKNSLIFNSNLRSISFNKSKMYNLYKPIMCSLPQRTIASIPTIFTGDWKSYTDPIFSITKRFQEDTNKNKINLGVGAYRDEFGKPWVLPIVRKVEMEIANDLKTNKEYLPMDGLLSFIKSTLKLLYGEDCKDIDNGLIQGVQTLSGTGANRLAMELLFKYHNVSNFYCPDPTWPIHLSILEYLGVKNIQKYKYYDSSMTAIPIDQILSTLKNAPERSAFVFHGCGHNPTGMDFSKEEWKLIADVIRARNIIPILDVAYLGFVSGSIDEDAYAVRLFHEMGIESLASVSFAKNMGLYNERAGLLAFYGKSKEITDQVKNRLTFIVRNSYSNPPIHGVEIVSRVLNTPSHKEQWCKELFHMSNRINSMRTKLHNLLGILEPSKDWSFIIKQRGLFSYTPLTEKQVAHIEKEYHIYMLKTGRINICGLTEHNLDYVSKAIVETIKAVHS